MMKLANELGNILSDSGMTILTGVVVVFGVLLLLTGVFKVFGKVMSAGGSDNEAVKAPAQAATSVAAPVAVPLGNTAPVTTTPTVQNGIPEETVVAISAAVASVAPAGTQYAVKSIMKI